MSKKVKENWLREGVHGGWGGDHGEGGGREGKGKR